MMELTDETLMAYVDGELDELEAEKVHDALLTNTKAQKQIKIFGESAALLRQAYDLPSHEDVPQYLIDGINDYKVRPKITGRIAGWLQGGGWQPIHALAFSMLLMVGIGAGWFIARTSEPELSRYSSVFQGANFSRGMDSTVSGMSFNLDNQQVSVTPITTFLDYHGHYCRQYEVFPEKNSNNLSSYGVACRVGAGDWLTRVSFFTKPPDLTPSNTDDSYILASDDELSATIFSNLMAAPPLTIKQEESVIREGWGVGSKSK